MVNLYGEVRLLDMSVMAYITRIKKTFLTDAMRYSNFIKIIIKILTNIMKKYLKKSVADWDKKKVLTLTVSKQWFDMILSGEKTEEYRAIKSYWINRLIQAKYGGSDEYRKVTMHPEFEMLISNSILKELLENKTARFIPYTYVRFFNGYAKNRPWIEKKIESISIGKPKKGLCPDKWLDTEFFIIKFKWYESKEYTKKDLPQHL